ncbi:nuclear transport factor 2 family protein [Spirosoma sp. KUDC1026]|uniref:nuclear transport factor 2 family protein n=1 Tax=Spirosoma sp. KUDC1026 TaxID=2745947 RepID=UPI00159BCCCD|nr:nuclear transport factor 2 family protein [Spirosoma sp. KUDC1026]QKZ14995.1 nuclear transport factor 2 family protein [Spirosoma sp. KUDC1026]
MKSILTLGFLLSFYAVQAQTSVAPSAGMSTTMQADANAVKKAELQRFEAQVKKDYTALERLLADDMIYVHSSGNSDTKQSYIQSIKDGKSRYDAIEPGEMNVRVYGGTAVINGTCTVKAINNGTTVDTKLRYTDVYVRKGNQWQMVAWQSLKAGQ